MKRRVSELKGGAELGQAKDDSHRTSNRVREHRSKVLQIYSHLAAIIIKERARALPVRKLGRY